MASLAESGQQTPIVVVAAADHRGRYVVIDGHKRIAALQQLGRDTVEATVWAMSEAEALLLERSLRFSRQESALEQGWLLAEMEQRFGYSLEELARRFDRSVSWVSRRLALVELLPEAIQQQVREGALARAPGDEVSGAGGARQPGALPADGRRFRPAPLRHAASRATLCRLARRLARGSRAHSGRAGTVFENAAAAAGRQAGRGRTRARSGDGGCHPASRQPAAGRSPAGDGLARNRNKRSARSKARAANSTGWRSESERNRERNMLSQAQRTAILELSAKGVTKREIARVLRVVAPDACAKCCDRTPPTCRKSNGRRKPNPTGNRSSSF